MVEIKKRAEEADCRQAKSAKEIAPEDDELAGPRCRRDLPRVGKVRPHHRRNGKPPHHAEEVEVAVVDIGAVPIAARHGLRWPAGSAARLDDDRTAAALRQRAMRQHGGATAARKQRRKRGRRREGRGRACVCRPPPPLFMRPKRQGRGDASWGRGINCAHVPHAPTNPAPLWRVFNLPQKGNRPPRPQRIHTRAVAM